MYNNALQSGTVHPERNICRKSVTSGLTRRPMDHISLQRLRPIGPNPPLYPRDVLDSRSSKFQIRPETLDSARSV